MISINYEKLTANTLTGENLKQYCAGKSGVPVTQLPSAKREISVRNPSPGPAPLGLWPGDLHFNHTSGYSFAR